MRGLGDEGRGMIDEARMRGFWAVGAFLAGFLTIAPAEGQRLCDHSSFIRSVGATPATEFVAGIADQRIYVCGVVLTAQGNAAAFQVVGGTGTNCGTGQKAVTNVYQLSSGGVLANRIPFTGEFTDVGQALCAVVTGSGTIDATVYWTQF